MSLELLREADMVLNACGRPTPPAGYRFVDLPRVIPWLTHVSVAPGTPFQVRISNNADTLFIVRGLSMRLPVKLRMRFPTGRFLSQNPSGNDSNNQFPQGFGGNMIALPSEMAIESGKRVSIEFSGTAIGDVVVYIWGVLRYLMRDTSDGQSKNAKAAASSCLVGYPANAKPPVDVAMIADPVAMLEDIPRYHCGPNGNIMAPETRLGNQCCDEIPAGYDDESFSFFSNPINVPANGESFGNTIIVPGGGADVVIKKVIPFVSLSNAFTAVPVFSLRLPNGYSVTGGDLVPTSLFPGGYAVFPTLRLRTGDRIVMDLADMLASGVGSSTTTFQFDGVKRRKVQ